MNPNARHFYGKRRPEIKRGLLSPYDTSVLDFYGLTIEELRAIPLLVQQDSGSFKNASILDIEFYEPNHCFIISYLIGDKRRAQVMTHNNLIINRNLNLNEMDSVAFLYTDDFITKQFAHACPSIALTLKAAMERFRFNPDKTKRTLKLLHDIFLHTLRPFTVDCPHADMNEAMDEIAFHMHNHFFEGDILIYQERDSGLVQALLVKSASKSEKMVELYYPDLDVTVRDKFPLRGKVLGYYSSDRFAYGSIPSLLNAFKADVASNKYQVGCKQRLLATFLENTHVVEFYIGLTGEAP